MKAFEKIAAEAISKAEQVKCALPMFVQGLREIRDAIDERLQLAKDEVAFKEGEDG